MICSPLPFLLQPIASYSEFMSNLYTLHVLIVAAFFLGEYPVLLVRTLLMRLLLFVTNAKPFKLVLN